MTLRLCLLGSILLLALCLAGPAAAGRPGRWDVVAAGPQAPTVSQELGIARTADGVLHVAWRQAFSDVLARPITPAGQLGATERATIEYVDRSGVLGAVRRRPRQPDGDRHRRCAQTRRAVLDLGPALDRLGPLLKEL